MEAKSCDYTNYLSLLQKETEVKEHVKTKEKVTLSIDVTSRPSSHEVAAADREVQVTRRFLCMNTLTLYEYSHFV